jgi:hypothetical protein
MLEVSRYLVRALCADQALILPASRDTVALLPIFWVATIGNKGAAALGDAAALAQLATVRGIGNTEPYRH